uniref:Putative glycosyl hydrolase family10 n=1 Tax=uncultured symbiotic protist of Neotermes koshunensis TaxID=403660 RepID=A4UWZ3_9EUKA|nr:putative glycosyl hydrolase family10 [uncultured symbiotic protist of Neotermes koshunensis]
MFVLLGLVLGSSPLAKGQSKFLGNIIAASVPANWDTYWNQATAENGCKWGSVDNGAGYNWGQCDVTANHCKTAGIPFKYHNFVWGSQEPSGSLTKDRIQKCMSAACPRYKAELIDVVNEPLHSPSNARNSLGGSGSSGWDWVKTSFEMAKTTCTGSKLLINEYGIINDSGAVSRYLGIVKACGSLIEGIGIQCHEFNINNLAASTASSNLATLATAGLPIYPSEMDVSATPESAQADVYKRIFPILWKSTSVKGITLWGWISGQTWKANTGIYEGGRERAALTWLKSYLDSADGKV